MNLLLDTHTLLLVREATVKHISLDHETERVKSFVRSLPVDPNGSILELNGKPVIRVLPVGQEPVDKRKLKAAILKRRNTSRKLNQEWEHVDQDVWAREAQVKE